MKILIVRFSSIGDVVLTTPVVRCVKQQLENAEVHYLTKNSFKILLENNPHIDKLWTITKSIDEVISALKKEEFDYVIDLHHNVRTLGLKLKLGVKSYSFDKLNIQKWKLVKFKTPMKYQGHIVERYFDAVKVLGVKNDGLPCDYFIPTEDEIELRVYGIEPQNYIAVAIGAQFETKQLPVSKLIEVLKDQELPIVLLGGKQDENKASAIQAEIPCVDLTGKLNLNSSAFVAKNARVLLTNDTGLMHIATCFPTVKIVSVWGNTVPALGMYPYLPTRNNDFSIHEVSDLKCRPCSKIGFHECPKGHFDCMMKQNVGEITKRIERF
ncbi:MAG TPA: glycosyltransferase family 9 protein [Crocinitomicaceae bacterium]|nr:glycosyltransferase family 9 protein [Crocinitomicaceae bacterium]